MKPLKPLPPLFLDILLENCYNTDRIRFEEDERKMNRIVRKILSVLLVCALLASGAACSVTKTGEGDEAEAAGNTPGAEEAEILKLGRLRPV